MTDEKTADECTQICSPQMSIRCPYESCIINCLAKQCEQNCTGGNIDARTHCDAYCANEKHCTDPVADSIGPKNNNCLMDDLIKQYVGNDPLKKQYIENKLSYIALTKEKD